MENNKQTIDISYESILKVVFVLATLFFLFYLRHIIFIILIAVIIALIMNPAVDSMHKRKIPRVLGALTLFLLTFLFMGLLSYFVIPPLAKEISQLASQFPTFVNQINIDESLIKKQGIDGNLAQSVQGLLIEISKSLKEAASSFVIAIFSLLGGIFSAILILVISFYLVVEEDGVEKFVKELIPGKFQPQALRIMRKIEIKLGRWFVGQISLGLIVGSLSLVGLYILGVPYAFVLAILAGILELIPYLGPTLSAIPAIIIAYTVSPLLAVLTLLLYFLIQQFENYLIVPKVMEKSVGLHPVVIIIVVLIGGQLGGVLGVILSVPFATILSIIFEDFYSAKVEKTGVVVERK